MKAKNKDGTGWSFRIQVKEARMINIIRPAIAGEISATVFLNVYGQELKSMIYRGVYNEQGRRLKAPAN